MLRDLEQPDNTMARARYASLLLQRHEVDEAERQFKEVLKNAPKDYRTRNDPTMRRPG
jgi:hypothetical protein